MSLSSITCLCLSLCMCIIPGGFQTCAKVESRGSINVRNHVWLLPFNHQSPLESKNLCQTCTSLMCECVTSYKQQVTNKQNKTKQKRWRCPNSYMGPRSPPPPPSSSSFQSVGCLPEGQSHSRPVITAALWCLCGETLCLMSMLINSVNDRSMWDCRMSHWFKSIAHLLFRD